MSGPSAAAIEKRSAELGALLLDLDLAVALENGERAASVLRRIAAIAESADLLEEESRTLRSLAEEPDGVAHLRASSAQIDRIEERLRLRFLPLHMELGAIAEAARLSALAESPRLWDETSSERYLRWALRRHRESLTASVRSALVGLLEARGSAEQQAAARVLLEALTS